MVPPQEQAEWLRQRRLSLEKLPVDRFPMLVALADTYVVEPDADRYFSFGIDLVIGAVEKMASSRTVTSGRPNNS
jgi:TetR/AcrR family tetracycline transcriptional repressor